MNKFAPISRVAGFTSLILLAAYISNTSLQRYLIGVEAGAPPILANAFANPWLAVHVIGAVVALLIGPVQFVGAIRRQWPRFHRAVGLTYVAACVVGAPAGVVLAFGTTAGPVTGSGFAALGLLSLYFTWQGLRAALARRFEEHREWMLRSYAMTAAAITLRLMIPAGFILGLDFFAAYRVIAWACWLANLALVELYIRRTRVATARLGVLAAA